jgi:serine/threonine protein kinase
MSSQTSPIRELADPWLESPTDPALQFRVGAWELTTRISQSLWHDVFRARAVDTGETGDGRYVVKVVRDDTPDGDWSSGMLAREWEAGNTIASPHVVSVLAGEFDVAWPHITFAHLAGISLGQRLDDLGEHRQLDLPTTVWIARQMAHALAAIHAAGWIHGDVKPENIHVGWNGHATLLDLGFALRLDEARAPGPFDPLCCTPRYAAPEQFDTFRSITPAADIYSLGCVVYECLIGSPPHEYANLSERIAARRLVPPTPISTTRTDIAPELERLLRSMVSRDPMRRPTAEELVEQLISHEVSLLKGTPATPSIARAKRRIASKLRLRQPAG